MAPVGEFGAGEDDSWKKRGFDSSNLSIIIEIHHIGDAVPSPLLPIDIQKELLTLQPPLLVQRSNGTTAGLGYLKVLELSVQILFLGRLASVRSVNSQWGRRIQFLFWFKHYYNHISIAPMHPRCKPTYGRQNHKQTPTEILYVPSSHQPIYEINIQKEWYCMAKNI